MQEVLVVIAIALAVFFLPRLMNRNSAPAPKFISHDRLVTILTGRIRLAILITIFWVTGCTAFLKPWMGSLFVFFCVGLAPALAFWGGVWVWAGYKRYRR